jgi:hypothetical protein
MSPIFVSLLEGAIVGGIVANVMLWASWRYR